MKVRAPACGQALARGQSPARGRAHMNSDNKARNKHTEDKYQLLKFGIMMDVPIFLEGPPGPRKRRGPCMSDPALGGQGGRVRKQGQGNT